MQRKLRRFIKIDRKLLETKKDDKEKGRDSPWKITNSANINNDETTRIRFRPATKRLDPDLRGRDKEEEDTT